AGTPDEGRVREVGPRDQLERIARQRTGLRVAPVNLIDDRGRATSERFGVRGGRAPKSARQRGHHVEAPGNQSTEAPEVKSGPGKRLPQTHMTMAQRNLELLNQLDPAGPSGP